MQQSHYFKPGQDLDHQFKTIEYSIEQQKFKFVTDRGVFSRNKVDYGTDVMLKAIIQELRKPEMNICADFEVGCEVKSETDFKSDCAKTLNCLDLGCGYGVVSIVLSTFFPKQRWYAVDINPRAINLVKKNLKMYDLDITAIEFDGVPDLGIKYDLALLNPPIRTGKEVYYRMFTEVAKVISDKGVFYTVIQKKQGAASAYKFLKKIFMDVSIIDKSGGYHTIRCSESKLFN